MNDILLSVNELLRGADIDWAVCGGWALDLFLGRTTRMHGDLDLSVPEGDRTRIERFMLDRGWRVYEFRGQGLLRPLHADTPSEPGRNLMCLREGCELVTFWEAPRDAPGLVLHEWHPSGLRTLNYMEFLFRRAEPFFGRSADKAVIRLEGIPCLAPEVVLRWKADQPERDVNRADFAAVFPRLSEEARAWLMNVLPPEHPWKEGKRHG